MTQPPDWVFMVLGYAGLVLVFAVVPFSLTLGRVLKTKHHVRCPETGSDETVGIGLARQTVYAILPVCNPNKLCDCSRWPARRSCDQGCTRQLAR